MQWKLVLLYQTPEDGQSWLFSKIDEYNRDKNNNLRITKNTNGEVFNLEDLNEDQFKLPMLCWKRSKNGSVWFQQVKQEKTI